MAWRPGESGNPKGRPPEVLEVREVRRLAQARTKDAYAVVEALMVGAEKDSVRLAAALAILKIAGMRMDGEVTVSVQPSQAGSQLASFPLERLLQMKTVNVTQSPTSSGDEAN